MVQKLANTDVPEKNPLPAIPGTCLCQFTTYKILLQKVKKTDSDPSVSYFIDKKYL